MPLGRIKSWLKSLFPSAGEDDGIIRAVRSLPKVRQIADFWGKLTAPGTLVTSLKEAVKEFFADNCPHLAAAIAYYLLFSLFPIILVMISVTGFILRSPALEAQVIEGIGNFIPVSGDFITSTIKAVISARGAIGIAATIGLIVAGTSVFNAIRKSLNAAWCIRKPRHFFLERLLEFSMLLGTGFLFLVWVLLTAGLRVIRELNVPVFGSILSGSDFFWNIAVGLVSIVLTFVVFLFLYRFVPNTQVWWRDVWLGALAAAICFELVKSGFVWLVGNFTQYNLVYGSVGTVIALLVWTYVSAVTFLFWAKLTSVYANRRCRLRAVSTNLE